MYLQLKTENSVSITVSKIQRLILAKPCSAALLQQFMFFGKK